MDRVVDPDLGHVQVDVGALLRPHGGDVVDLEAEPLDLSQERQLVLGVGNLSIGQVWSLTQFHSVNFLPSRKKVLRVCVLSVVLDGVLGPPILARSPIGFIVSL